MNQHYAGEFEVLVSSSSSTNSNDSSNDDDDETGVMKVPKHPT